jgi:hypothetical protein
MPIWKLLKMARSALGAWRDLPAREKEHVRAEAEHVGQLTRELAQLAGRRGRRIYERAQLGEFDRALASDGGALVVAEPSRDVGEIASELLTAVGALSEAVGPSALEKAKAGTPRSLRLASKVGGLMLRGMKRRASRAD